VSGGLRPARDHHASSEDALSPLAPKEVRLIAPDRWDELASTFRDVVPEQTAAYACARWGRDRVRCLAVSENGQVIGGGLLVDFNLPVLQRGLSVLKFGPLWRMSSQDDDPDRLNAVIHALQSHVADIEKRCLIMIPLPDPLSPGHMADALLAAGFQHRGSIPDPARYLVNLGIDLAAQRSSLHGKWRYNLKKAQSQNLEIAIVPGDEGLATFMQLYDAMLLRKRFDDHSGIDALPAMVTAAVPSLRPEIVIARLDGTPTAGAVISRAGDRAMYMFGATDDRALGVKAGYALHWWILEHLTGSGPLWYDLGGAEGDPGLAQFKRQFVGAKGIITERLDEYAYATDPISRVAAFSIFGLRNAKRRWLARSERAAQ